MKIIFNNSLIFQCSIPCNTSTPHHEQVVQDSHVKKYYAKKDHNTHRLKTITTNEGKRSLKKIVRDSLDHLSIQSYVHQLNSERVKTSHQQSQHYIKARKSINQYNQQSNKIHLPHNSSMPFLFNNQPNHQKHNKIPLHYDNIVQTPFWKKKYHDSDYQHELFIKINQQYHQRMEDQFKNIRHPITNTYSIEKHHQTIPLTIAPSCSNLLRKESLSLSDELNILEEHNQDQPKQMEIQQKQKSIYNIKTQQNTPIHHTQSHLIKKEVAKENIITQHFKVPTRLFGKKNGQLQQIVAHNNYEKILQNTLVRKVQSIIDNNQSQYSQVVPYSKVSVISNCNAFKKINADNRLLSQIPSQNKVQLREARSNVRETNFNL